MAENFFEQLLAIMSASLVATMLLRRLRLPNIIAYLLAGAVVGPHLMGWVDQPADFAFLAEFGVVFLLFSLGLEFSLPKLIALRASVFGLGGIQVVFCTLAFGAVVWLWGASVEAVGSRRCPPGSSFAINASDMGTVFSDSSAASSICGGTAPCRFARNASLHRRHLTTTPGPSSRSDLEWDALQ